MVSKDSQTWGRPRPNAHVSCGPRRFAVAHDVPGHLAQVELIRAMDWQTAPKWSGGLAAFDVYIWDQCYSMEQSLRIG